ncbi:MAG: hypothetical protein ABI700_31340 [Chloroflexota bacterium]
MPYKITWYQSDRIVLMQVDGLLTTPEVQSLIAESGTYVASGTPLVHFLVDTRALQKIESVPEALKVVQGNPPHPNMGWMVVVGKMNPLVKFFLDFVGLLTKSRYRRFDTMPESLDFLKEIDGSLSTAKGSGAGAC